MIAELPDLEPWEEILKYVGFKLERRDAHCVQGRFIVSERSCQSFGVLHGGVSALIAEALGSAGAVIASGYQRVAGIQLSINHLKAVPVGVEVWASAKPLHAGQRLQVWDVQFFIAEGTPSSSASSAADVPSSTLIATSRVTLMLRVSEEILHINSKL